MLSNASHVKQHCGRGYEALETCRGPHTSRQGSNSIRKIVVCRPNRFAHIRGLGQNIGEESALVNIYLNESVFECSTKMVITRMLHEATCRSTPRLHHIGYITSRWRQEGTLIPSSDMYHVYIIFNREINI